MKRRVIKGVTIAKYKVRLRVDKFTVNVEPPPLKGVTGQQLYSFMMQEWGDNDEPNIPQPRGISR